MIASRNAAARSAATFVGIVLVSLLCTQAAYAVSGGTFPIVFEASIPHTNPQYMWTYNHNIWTNLHVAAAASNTSPWAAWPAVLTPLAAANTNGHQGNCYTQVTLNAPIAWPTHDVFKASARVTAKAPVIPCNVPQPPNETDGKSDNGSSFLARWWAGPATAPVAKTVSWFKGENEASVKGKDPLRVHDQVTVDGVLAADSDMRLVTDGDGGIGWDDEGLHFGGSFARYSWDFSDLTNPSASFSHWAQLADGVFTTSESMASLPWQVTYDGGTISDVSLAAESVPSLDWKPSGLSDDEHELGLSNELEANDGVSAVPEPGSLLALGGGLVGLAGMVIRRRR